MFDSDLILCVYLVLSFWVLERTVSFADGAVNNFSALDKLLGQLGIYAKQLRIFIFFTPRFFSVITHFLIA